MATRTGPRIGDTTISFDVVNDSLNAVTITMQRSGVPPVYTLLNADGTVHTRIALDGVTELSRTIQIRPRIAMPFTTYSSSQHGGLRTGEARQLPPGFTLTERD